MEDIDNEGSNLGFNCICGIFVILATLIILLHEVIKDKD